MATLDEDIEHLLYVDCLTKQLEEINLLSSIYCNPGELEIHDPSVISDLNEFIDDSNSTNATLRSQLDFSIYFQRDFNKSTHLNQHHHQHQQNNKIEIRFFLPHLYPLLENANVVVRNSLFTKQQECFINKSTKNFIDEIDKNETYCYQIIMWLQDNLDELLSTAENTENINNVLKALLSSQASSSQTLNNETETSISPPSSSSMAAKFKEIFERLWIYSHHIKSKTKRHAILKNAKDLELTGFCRPGKPGVICVEGTQENTQKFWRLIKSMHWQKITIKKIEIKQISSVTTSEDGITAAATATTAAAAASPSSSSIASTISSLSLSSPNSSCIDRYRRFSQFKEELFTNIGGCDNNEEKMNMSLFIKFLELHNSGYIKKELFGID